MKKTILLISVLYLLSSVFLGHASPTTNQYSFYHVNQDANFSFNGMSSIQSDKNGMVWIGFHDGLYYYNSSKYKQYLANATDKTAISSNNILSLYRDSQQRIWVCTSKGLARYASKSDSFVRYGSQTVKKDGVQAIIECDDRGDSFLAASGHNIYRFSCDDPSSLEKVERSEKSLITVLYKDGDGRVYVGTDDGSVYYMSSDYDKLTLIHKAENIITAIYKANNGSLYVGYKEQGVSVFDSKFQIVESYRQQYVTGANVGKDYIHAIAGRNNGDIWCATSSGVFIIHPDGQTEWINHIVSDTANQNSILALHVDDNDNVWIGLWGGHIVMYSDYNNQFDSETMLSFSDNKRIATCHFSENSKGILYIGRESGGLYTFNPETSESKDLIYEQFRVKSVAVDSKDNLWVGTFKNGLYYKGAHDRDLSEVKLPEQYKKTAIINAITIDEKHNAIWIGSRFSGILRYDTKLKKFDTTSSGEVMKYISRQIWSMSVNRNGDLIVSSDRGIEILPYNTSEFVNYQYRGSNNSTHKTCFSHIILNEDEILVGTQKQGVKVFNTKSGAFKELEGAEQLAALDIYKILIDNNGNIWTSTSNGIYVYYQSSKHMIHFGAEDGLVSNTFFPNSGFISSNGTVFFGSTAGFNYIDANSIKENKISPQVFISNIFVNYEQMSADNVLKVNSLHMEDVNEIVLSPQNNSLLFEITSNNMLKRDNNRFKYILRNHQERWVEISNNTDIAFTELPYGKYTLDLMSCNNDGVWGDITSIDITIKTPVLMRWWAWVLYVFIVVVIIYCVVRTLKNRARIEREIELERHKNAIDTEAFEQKMQFFMNISHELRTPLSLIITPLNILERENQNRSFEPYINTIKRNANKLLRLTNQILDLRLLEVGKITALKESNNIVELCREAIEYFRFQISEKRIDFRFVSECKSLFTFVDYDMIDKVVCNILSNALKFSADESQLTLQVKRHDTYVDDSANYDFAIGEAVDAPLFEVIVSDQGRGITKENIPNIFDRFYYKNSADISGSGIGLHICREYVALHNGVIRVKSQEGEGTTFSVLIPMVNYSDVEESVGVVDESIRHDINLTINTSSDNENCPTILIADDNNEIRTYLKKILSGKFKCLTANNGEQALEMATATNPDLILMDVLMPAMNGVDCVRALRAQKQTQSTPIILLTGVTNDQTIIDSMNAGADCYLSKPININLLSAHISRLLDKVQSQVELEAQVTSIASEAESVNSGNKGGLMQNIEAIIASSYSNSMLDADTIAQQLKMSRSTLHRHVKKELNVGVSELIKDYRLREAVRLMNAAQYNIDELALCVGFNSTSYFCKSFKDKYGTSPKKYSNQLHWTQDQEEDKEKE